jgi:putative flavoprotein involved in K+ transport
VETSVVYDVVIIGAGPAGLVLANHLKDHNVLILEKDIVGSSWANMPSHLNLITFWKSNYLREEDKGLFPLNKAQSAKEFHCYLNTLSKGISILGNTEVLNIEKGTEFFSIYANRNVFKSKLVVNCTGYYSNPFVPKFSRSNLSIPLIHFKDYKNSTQLSECQNILIVGKRLSSGQLIEELSKEGKTISLSVRSSIKYGAHGASLSFSLFFLPFIDWLLGFILKNKKLEVNISGSVRNIIETKVEIYEDIKSINSNLVTFSDGKVVSFDAVIFATGFKEVFGHLSKNVKIEKFQSVSQPGLYFLGFEGQVNFKSRFLRGIRNDSLMLAKILNEKLGSSNE